MVLILDMNRRVALLLAALVCASCGAFSPSADDLRNDPHGHLIWAARTGDVAAIRRLAASGVDLDASTVTPSTFVFPDLDHIRWTALKHAVQKHRVDAVRVLLEWGADPDAREAGSAVPPLFIAAGLKDPTIARLLLDAGADVNLSRKALTLDGPGGPLWHVVEHALERVTASRWSREVALERLGATGPSRP
jgi:ankyrin repeat protein